MIARNSSFQYKGKSVDIRQVGRDLGVRYVLEGSVRRAGDRIRIAAQLIDATTGTHRWAERYDRKLEDVFAVQDEVVRTIVGILAAHVKKAETERTRTKPPSNWQAYDYYLRAAEAAGSFMTSYNVEDIYAARRLLEMSLALDPNYARSYALLAGTHMGVYVNRLDSDYLNPVALDRAHQFARKAVLLDPNLPEAHAQPAIDLASKHQHDASVASIEKALALNPNYVDWRFVWPPVLAGQSRRATDLLKTYMRFDPFHRPMAYFLVGAAHFTLKEYSQALAVLRTVPMSPRSRKWRTDTFGWCDEGSIGQGHRGSRRNRRGAATESRRNNIGDVAGPRCVQSTPKTTSTSMMRCARRGYPSSSEFSYRSGPHWNSYVPFPPD